MEDKVSSQAIYENKMQTELRNVKGLSKKRSTQKIDAEADQVFNALNYAAN